jgi:hypothetical protein
MIRYLCGDSEEDRQRMREEVLKTTARDFTAFAEYLAQMEGKGITKVLGSSDAITAAGNALPGGLKILPVL